MLKPDKNRLNYSDMLKPPVGYEVEFAIGTTYSLDLEALIGVPLALSLAEEMGHAFHDNPIFMLEGLRRASDKFLIFCEAGQIKVPQNNNTIFALVENSVCEIALENNLSFHPKLWLIKYVNEENRELYRLLVLTRNLTFDRSWDLALALEGEKQEEVNTKTKPLKDFFQFLLPYVPDATKVESMKKLISALDYVHFVPGGNFVDYDFLPLGIEEYSKDKTELFDTYHDLIIMSPFLSGSTINEIKEKKLSDKKFVLITRRTELHKLPHDILDYSDIYVLKEMIVDGEGVISEEDEEEMGQAQQQDIHAKLYAKSKYNQHHFYIGSANCSRNAFHGNVEFLLKLKYKKYGFKMQQLLEDLFGKDEEDNPFEKIDVLPVFEEEKEDDVLEQLQKGIKQLCRSDLRAYVTKTQSTYSLAIQSKELQGTIRFFIKPLLSQVQEQLLDETVLFSDLNLVELGEFYRVKAVIEDAQIERIIKIDTEGIPAERDSEIYKSIIRDPATFLRYVAFLLADDFLLAALEQFERSKKGNIVWDSAYLDGPILYENMLKTVSRSPDKLNDVEYVMDIIRDEEIIPEDFEKLYQIFKRANQNR
ncbi:phospholipase D family protein [Bacillus sp. JJ1533]|uniref:phospholipase D family protein n=1 Tax=Bacillus sp. JJ1533 TaxID=3122959 RepID=UPI0030008E4F